MDYDVFNGDADGILSLVQLQAQRSARGRAGYGTKAGYQTAGPRGGESSAGQTRDGSGYFHAVELWQDVERILEEGRVSPYISTITMRAKVSIIRTWKRISIRPAKSARRSWSTNILSGAHRAWAVAASYGDNFPAMAERLAAWA